MCYKDDQLGKSDRGLSDSYFPAFKSFHRLFGLKGSFTPHLKLCVITELISLFKLAYKIIHGYQF